ncbi:MAG: T9SS type A sorting domain-containing protein [Saprospiraceae bacterium]|nr:T9SS type A sorting domain-containing protein [Saprospiraceae bacterium]
MKRLFTLFIFLAFVLNINAQKLVNVTLITSLSKLDISALAGGLPAAYAVDLYKVQYMTADVNGDDHLASGLLCVPNDGSTAFPLAAYQHGTVGGRNDVPSNLQGGFTLPLVFAAFGYVVCAADFVGLGDSQGIHPYVHAKTEASAAIDLLIAARELDADDSFEDFTLNDQVFVTGYSQGGHAAMAAHRELETNYSSEFTVTASAPMSGPYSISDKMIDFTLGDDPYSTVAYLAWLTLGYQSAYPELLKDLELEDIFKPEYIADILEFKNENISLWDLNDRITATLNSTVGAVVPKNMLLPNILESILTDPDHPLSIALADNDTFDWAPSAPTNLYYCVGDDQVTFENAILASQVMNDNGAAAVNGIRIDTDNNLLDHGGCVSGAATGALFFFGSFQQLLSSNENIAFDLNTRVYYSNGQVNVDIPLERAGQFNQMSIYSQTGQMVWQRNISKGQSSFDISHLPMGMFVVTLRDDRELYKTVKMVKF